MHRDSAAQSCGRHFFCPFRRRDRQTDRHRHYLLSVISDDWHTPPTHTQKGGGRIAGLFSPWAAARGLFHSLIRLFAEEEDTSAAAGVPLLFSEWKDRIMVLLPCHRSAYPHANLRSGGTVGNHRPDARVRVRWCPTSFRTLLHRVLWRRSICTYTHLRSTVRTPP